ncbi:hypothetical protein [Methylophilus aquaticus]|uniref:Uncharacterized protein n=1 Tax=Methylophilus aquaticus TaxID=1971610 RepID=A0ABT9JV97_9PROT|nr:hypothetical protein [Methylophilus aquaticus]MDP8568513.1 hypothetical protein [Methylophilus aquaticus]
MQIFKSYNVVSVALYLVAGSIFSASMPALAENSAQIIALQNKVNALEKELLIIKSLLNQNASSEDTDTRTDKEITLSALDKLTLKVGKSSLELSKNGRVTLNGTVFDVKTTQDTEIRGSKIRNN